MDTSRAIQKSYWEAAATFTAERSEAALAAISDGVWILDRNGRVVFSNRHLEQVFGGEEEIVGRACEELSFCRRHCGEACLFQQVKATGEVCSGMLALEGDGRYFRTVMYPIWSDEGVLMGGTHLFQEITELVDNEQRHRVLEATVNQSSDLVMVASVDMRIAYVNPAFLAFADRGDENLIGSDAMQFAALLGGASGFDQMQNVARSGEPFRGLLKVRDARGARALLFGTVSPLFDEAGEMTHLVCTGRDITHERQLERKVRHLAYFDGLTGLPNRALFPERLAPASARTTYNGRACAVILIDLDGFKAVNDALGPAAGDAVLLAVASSLSDVVRDGDTVARLGSDEFGVALIDLRWPEDVPLVMEKLQRSLADPNRLWEQSGIDLTACIGVAVCPDDGTEPEELIKKAGLALTAAKREGAGKVSFYSAEMSERAETFLSTAARLRKALERDELRAFYQPYYDIATGALAGMEALMRWQPEGEAVVPPFKFIPVMEETGLIVPAGYWILEEAARQIGRWQEAGLPVVPVAVNLSPLQFQAPDLLQSIEAIISRTGVDPMMLTFEITESTFMDNPDYTREVLVGLQGLGAKISIDDFGTGYSSLAHLKRFPVDHLKIDMSFVRDIVEDVDDATIVSAIISMAHNLGIKTIAEGVETEEHLKILRILRCDIAQGYLYTPPVPPEKEDALFGRVGSRE